MTKSVQITVGFPVDVHQKVTSKVHQTRDAQIPLFVRPSTRGLSSSVSLIRGLCSTVTAGVPSDTKASEELTDVFFFFLLTPQTEPEQTTSFPEVSTGEQ